MTKPPCNPTLTDVFGAKHFEPRSASAIQALADGKHFTRLEDEKRVVMFRISTGARVRTLFNAHRLKAYGADRFHSYAVSHDGKVMVAANHRKLYRHSWLADHFIYDPRTKRTLPLSRRGPQRLATFSPDGTGIAFVHDNDLYVTDLVRRRERRLTRDGKAGCILNGAPDWVYEEEFVLVRAFAWSPDSRYLLYLRFDETRVKEHELAMYQPDGYPRTVRYKYPRAGEANAMVAAYVADVHTGRTVTVDTGRGKDRYLPWLGWAGDTGACCLVRMNRLQNRAEVLLADPTTGTSHVLLREKHERYVELGSGPVFLNGDRGLLWTSEHTGYRHLYHYDLNGTCRGAVTRGPYEVDFAGYDAETDRVFYISTEISCLERHLYSSRLDGSDRKKLTRQSGWHACQFTHGSNHYVQSCSSTSRPPRFTLHDARGKLVRTLEDNAQLQRRVRRFGLAPREFFTCRAADGTMLNGWMVKPRNFSPRKKYPVVMTVYGGPGSQTVTNQWSYGWEQILASKGFVVASVDGRGTGGRGNEFRSCTYLQLGRYETDDQVAAARHLGRLPFVDRKRIGIFGWSYGGFMAANCLLHAPKTFAAGIAVAPVTHWRYYDSVYTERYMRRPKDNPEGYGNYCPLSAATQLERPLLVMHGMADDNVHVQNTHELVNALIKAGKQFEVHTVPNRDHGIEGDGAREHLFTRMTDFFTRYLGG